ncbi:MAG: hypothetical protein ACJ74Y_18515 [Bryobacteraceae bacterium]
MRVPGRIEVLPRLSLPHDKINGGLRNLRPKDWNAQTVSRGSKGIASHSSRIDMDATAVFPVGLARKAHPIGSIVRESTGW